MNEQLLKKSGADVLSSREKLRKTLLYIRGLIPSYNVFSVSFYVSPNFEIGFTVITLINPLNN